ncbi:aromatic acid exporter family protein [Ammoniphilus resinae]|uniref:Uncharacterized membrane protein YgaE (UPF0421/DUF939 family) n=1 Tax=Ammoniphilus resinae TaxID=861532 RepID=A0ABS4GN22_9BACL|nr:aromatic acid exporter family protein [Ammoniphilus resinae]MBP1931676.1 uncharacterized membrane protein YgaE (UPF0421/DUF939 family) [Ammoniphilus resinae]
MKIGYRIFKTALGAPAAIFIAQTLNLEYFVSAGILTILSIQATRKKSIKSALDRLFSCFIGLLIGYCLFEWIGYAAYSMAVLLLIYIPILVRLKIQDGFVTGVVIILHLYLVKAISLPFIINELQLMGVGLGVGLIMNLYMPNIDKKLKEQHQKIEQNFSKILKEFAIYLRNGESTWDGKEWIETEDLLKQAKNMAMQKGENLLLRSNDDDYIYFEMREKQFYLLESMLPKISSMNQDTPHAKQMADFVENLSNHIHSGNTAHIFLEELEHLRGELRKVELPETYEKFEARAALFYVINEFERYLYIKQEFFSTSRDKENPSPQQQVQRTGT